MDKENIKENLGLLPEIKAALTEIKALFTTEKAEVVTEAVAEVVAEVPKVEETKVEFNHEEFTKNFNEFKTSNDETIKSFNDKFASFEAQIKTANDTITKQGEILSQTFALVEKLAEAPVALSKQTKKEGVAEVKTNENWLAEMAEWRNKVTK
jgi:hypothetical protein